MIATGEWQEVVAGRICKRGDGYDSVRIEMCIKYRQSAMAAADALLEDGWDRIYMGDAEGPMLAVRARRHIDAIGKQVIIGGCADYTVLETTEAVVGWMHFNLESAEQCCLAVIEA